MSSEVEQSITSIITDRLQRTLSAPSRLGIKVWNNMTHDHEYQNNTNGLGNGRFNDVKYHKGIFSNEDCLSETFAHITARNIKHPNKTISSTNKTLESTRMKWNERS